MILKKSLLFLVCFSFSLNGCGGGGGSISVLPSTEEFEQTTNADVKIDILFVVDDSGSMAQEQQDLYDNFVDFINLFYDKGFDFRVAVAKTSAYGLNVNCKMKVSPFTNRTCNETGTYKYSSGNFIARENGLTPKEFRCGYGNNCGVNSEFQTESSIPNTEDPESENGEDTLMTTYGNGTPAPGTDHILASSSLSKAQMINKFKKNILVGLAGTGDERALESAETVIRNMKQFYAPADRFPRPNSHLAIIHVGDEGDGPIPNVAANIKLSGSNKNTDYADAGSCMGASSTLGVCKSTWGSLRSDFINSPTAYFNTIPGIPNYAPIDLVNDDDRDINNHLASVDSYLQALKNHEPSATVSVHAIQDLPRLAEIAQTPFLPVTAVDTTGNHHVGQAGNAIGYFQAYMANQSHGGLIFSKESNFATSLALLGDTISSLASFFQLENTKLDAEAQSNLKVYVEGINGNNPVPNNATNGYQYDEALNRISFYGSMIPPQGATIGLVYTCATLTCPAFP